MTRKLRELLAIQRIRYLAYKQNISETLPIHSDIRMTARYCHQDDAKKRAAIAKISGMIKANAKRGQKRTEVEKRYRQSSKYHSLPKYDIFNYESAGRVFESPRARSSFPPGRGSLEFQTALNSRIFPVAADPMME